MQKYRLIWDSFGFWLRPIEEQGMTFEEGKKVILETYKSLSNTWKNMDEATFLKGEKDETAG